jgi:hypothetical protein
MVKNLLIACAVSLAFLAAGVPAMAHHSANAEFDTSKELELTGVLTKLEYLNPHSWWYLDVKGADGNVTSWRLESLAPSGLIRQGVKVKEDIKIGETYTFTVAPAWKEGPFAFMKAITVNGRKVTMIEL